MLIYPRMNYKFSSCYSLEKVKKQNHLKTRWDLWIWRYVLEGCFKVFYQDGREHILYFAIEDWWVLDIDSFVSGKTSKLYIQALEDSVILTIDRAKKEQLYHDIPEWKIIQNNESKKHWQQRTG
jgi:hypothetical protein